MVGKSNTKLRMPQGVKVSDASLTEILLENFVNFYDWGLLDAGQYYTISIPQSGIYGGDRHKLRVADDPNYNSGQIWEAYRQNWVWEGSNIDGTTEQPVTISGVYVDNTFYATGNVTKPFYIDYPNGRVVFDSAVPSTSSVHLEYSHKAVQVVPAKGIPWFRQIQQGSFRNEDGFQVAASGGWAQLGQTRVQLPAIAVEVIPTRNTKPYELGGGQWVHSDIVFYVLTEQHWECTNLVDTVTYQNDRTLDLFDPTMVGLSGAFPFNYRNELVGHAVPSGLYPNLTANYHYRRCWVFNSRADGITQLTPELYIGTARCTTEVRPV
tara:strand:+ start:8016 stop:8984 length:969 start_codon:yes stop_codon:yes gene_type:complete